MSLASNAALLMLTLPVSTAFLAFIFLHEKMTAMRWVSFGLAITGVLMCSDIDFRSLNFGKGYLYGNLLIFVGTLGSAFYNSYSKKCCNDTRRQKCYFSPTATFLVMTPLALAQEPKVFAVIAHFTVQTWIGLALLSFFHNYLSMVLFLKALKQLDAIQAALSNYLITFFGIPIAAIWLKEKLTSLAIIGGVLILGSTLLDTVWESRQGSRKCAAVPAVQ